MKMGPIHPIENEYYWKDADSIAAFAKKHGMRLRGHNLWWHAQAPSWMFKDEEGDTVSKEVLLQRLKDHGIICGEEYIAKAFEYAQAADLKAVLFYNDYNTENPKKREKIYQMVKRVKEAGIRGEMLLIPDIHTFRLIAPTR